MVRDIAREGCDAVAVVCTNMRAAPLVERLEAELDIPIFDSIATTAWKSLVRAGVASPRLPGWGRLFRPSIAPIAFSAGRPSREVGQAVDDRPEAKTSESQAATSRSGAGGLDSPSAVRL
jgi:hypothetical protein